jgi:hypothetical protein
MLESARLADAKNFRQSELFNSAKVTQMNMNVPLEKISYINIKHQPNRWISGR